MWDAREILRASVKYLKYMLGLNWYFSITSLVFFFKLFADRIEEMRSKKKRFFGYLYIVAFKPWSERKIKKLGLSFGILNTTEFYICYTCWQLSFFISGFNVHDQPVLLHEKREKCVHVLCASCHRTYSTVMIDKLDINLTEKSCSSYIIKYFRLVMYDTWLFRSFVKKMNLNFAG